MSDLVLATSGALGSPSRSVILRLGQIGAHNRGERMAEAASFFTDGQAYERLMGRWSRAAGEVFLDWLSLPKGLN
jgi:hypothetical protein